MYTFHFYEANSYNRLQNKLLLLASFFCGRRLQVSLHAHANIRVKQPVLRLAENLPSINESQAEFEPTTVTGK